MQHLESNEKNENIKIIVNYFHLLQSTKTHLLINEGTLQNHGLRDAKEI
jgi:hypothetical protein